MAGAMFSARPLDFIDVLNTEKISRILLSPSFTTDLYSIRTLIHNLIKKDNNLSSP
jgi:hypothetical protein